MLFSSNSSPQRRELIRSFLNLPNLSQGQQAILVNKLYDTSLTNLQEVLLQVSHVCMTHGEAEVQTLLRNYMLWVAGQSFSLALRLAWTVDSVISVFETIGLGDRVQEVQDKIESFAINRSANSRKVTCDDITEEEVARKEMRLKLYNDEKKFFSTIANMSNLLRYFPDKARRQIELKSRLREINESLSRQLIVYPLDSETDPVRWIVHIAVDDCAVFSSRERAPFLLRCEVIIDETATLNDPVTTKLRLPDGRIRLSAGTDETLQVSSTPVTEEIKENGNANGNEPKRHKFFRSAFGEMPADRAARIRRKSPYGKHPNWGIASIIVKAGDDLRQEELALQLIDIFNKIWKESGLTCFVRPYGALSVGPDSGVIECVDGAASLDGIKKSCQVECLPQFFSEAFGPKGSASYLQAQRNFVETLAGYSVVSYLLQIKDRHNGNLMITNEGHLVHIDFGFMLVTSPGGLNFESAPFKLSQELLDVMGGVGSPSFDYFKVLVYQGLVAARERSDDIIGLVSLMTPYNTIACFGSDPIGAVQQLRSRFRFELETEADYAVFVKDLIIASVDNWRTRRYDQFQTLQNGIL